MGQLCNLPTCYSPMGRVGILTFPITWACRKDQRQVHRTSSNTYWPLTIPRYVFAITTAEYQLAAIIALLTNPVVFINRCSHLTQPLLSILHTGFYSVKHFLLLASVTSPFLHFSIHVLTIPLPTPSSSWSFLLRDLIHVHGFNILSVLEHPTFIFPVRTSFQTTHIQLSV